MNRITHRDIAGTLGLSQSTVSRGLGNDPSIPIATRKKIALAAQELGYRPHHGMQEIAFFRWQKTPVGRGSVIAFVDTLNYENYVGGLDVTASVRVQASILGYDLAVFRRIDFSNSDKLQKNLRNRGITDVIIGPVLEKSLVVELQWEKFICVQFTPGFFPLPVHSVTKDHFQTVLLAWQKAVERGYRRIGVLLLRHPVKIMDDILRNGAVRTCQHDLYPHLPRLKPFFFPPEDPTKGFSRWIKSNRPDVIIGFSGAHYEIFLSEYGYAIPYICLHNSPGDHLSGIPQDAPYFAREAVNLLHFCRRTHQWGIPERRIEHVIEPTWFEGDSLPHLSPPSPPPG